MAEFTKGEWKASNHYPHTIYATDGKRPPTTTSIATMIAPDSVELEANARLIAAAPAMYKALEAWSELYAMRPMDSGDDINEILERCWAKTEKALSQAEGK